MRYSLSKHGPVGLRQLRERKRLKSMERAKKKGNVKLDLGKKLEKKGFLPSAALLMRKPNTSKALKESLWRLQNYRVMKERRQRVMAFFLNRGIDWSLVHRHRLVKKYITQYTKEVTRADLLGLAREVGRKRTELQKKLEQRNALTVDIEKRAERIKAAFAEVGLGEDIFEDLIKDESLAFYEWVLTGEIRGPAATPNGGEGENSGESKQKGKSSVVTGEEGVRRAMADGLKWSMVKMVLQTIRQVLEKQGIPWRWVRNNARDQKEGEEGQKPWKLYKREAMAGWNLLGPSRADEQRLLVRQEVERLVALREARERRKALVKRLIDDKLRGRSNNNQVILKKLWQLFALDEDTYDVWEHYELDFWKTEIAEKITGFIKGKGFSSWRSNSHNASSSSSSASSAMEEAASLIEPVVEKLVAFVIRKEELRQALHFLGYGMPPSGIVSTPFRLYMEGNDKVSLNDCALALARGFNKAEMEAMRTKMAERRSAEACEGIHPYLRRKEEERLRGKDEDDDEDDDSFDDEDRPKTRCLLLEEGEWTSSDEDEEEELIAKRGNKKKRSGYSHHRLTVSAKKKRKRKSGGSSGGSRAPKRKTKRRRKSRSSRTLSPNQQSAQTSQEEDDDDDDAEEEESEEEEEDEDESEEEEDEEEEDEPNADSRFHPYNFFFKRSPGYR
ncbi:Striatin domain-containing protein [Balamuthia mandrillaris]